MGKFWSGETSRMLVPEGFKASLGTVKTGCLMEQATDRLANGEMLVQSITVFDDNVRFLCLQDRTLASDSHLLCYRMGRTVAENLFWRGYNVCTTRGCQ